MPNPIQEVKDLLKQQAALLRNADLEEAGRQMSEIARLRKALYSAAEALRNAGDHKASRAALAAYYRKEEK